MQQNSARCIQNVHHVVKRVFCATSALYAQRSSALAGTAAHKPPLSQKVRFVDSTRIEIRGGKGGGGSSALFGRTGVVQQLLISQLPQLWQLLPAGCG
jgi:hypothetical protein